MWLAAIVCVALTAGPGPAPAPKAADGTPFPSVTAKPFSVDAPLVAELLGQTPQDVRHPVYSANTSAATLKKQGVNVRGDEWFMLRYRGCDLASFDVDGGRICGLTLHYRAGGAAAAERLRAQLGVLTPAQAGRAEDVEVGGIRYRVYIAAEEGGAPAGRGPFFVSVFVDRVDWYLLNHAGVPAEVAAAMRRGELARGMTLEQARLTRGWDGEKASESAAGVTYRWEEGSGVWFADFRDGVCVSYSKL